MTRAPLRTILALTLALSLAGMSVLAASARGQTRAGGEVLVLCSGGGLVQITLDANGEPTGGAHLCPDLALGLLAALSLVAVAIERPATAGERAAASPARPVALRAGPALRARDPPVRL